MFEKRLPGNFFVGGVKILIKGVNPHMGNTQFSKYLPSHLTEGQWCHGWWTIVPT